MGGYGYVGEYNVERLWVSNVLFWCLICVIVKKLIGIYP
jgi:alkylation response protein AidB-like acyl-CoA dehydrogenase